MTEPTDFVCQRITAADGSILILVDGTDFEGYGSDQWWLRRSAVDGTFSIEQSGGIAWGGTWHNDYSWDEGLARLSPEGRARANREREQLNGNGEIS